MGTRAGQQAAPAGGLTMLTTSEARTILGGGGDPPAGWYIDFIGNPVPPVVRPMGPLY